MTPQASFTIVAPLDRERATECRKLLATMNDRPGRADPANAILPFGDFDTLHFARVCVIDDATLDDIAVYDLPRRDEPLYLCFLGDVDGDAHQFLEDLVRRAQMGLRTLFSFCLDFEPGDDILAWIVRHLVTPSASYGNWRGRTVRQIREEASLYEALRGYVAANTTKRSAREIHEGARAFVERERAGGSLSLSPEAPTPAAWRWANLAHLVAVPLLLVVVAIPLAIVAIFVAIRLRALERSDPELCDRPSADHVASLSVFEDHDVTNGFSAIGSLKPGALRLWLAAFVLWIVDYTTRHIFTRGRLARVHTIHFARWVFIDGGRRLMFCSNYDGSLDSYMDDFINKVAFGLNLVFSNGIGYPRTRWLALDGAKDEGKFKNFLRRHQFPNDVWYNSHPGLTAFDLQRNQRVRAGIESRLGDGEVHTWAALL